MKTSIGTLLALSAIFCSLTGCQSRSPEPASTNKLAAISGHLPYNPLAWKAITTSTTQHEGTMSTLYGNDTAVAHAHAGADGPYHQGSVLAVVTWKQRDDPHWFGATIPSHPQSVEFITISSTTVRVSSAVAAEQIRISCSPLLPNFSSKLNERT